MIYSVAHTHKKPVWELAQLYGFDMYQKRLNTWVRIWCIDIPEDSKYATRLLLEFGSYLTPIKD